MTPNQGSVEMPGLSTDQRRRVSVLVAGSTALALGLASLASTAASAAGPPARCVAGAPGLGDPYYPTYGNGGYDVRRYDLDVAYDPATDVLDGRAEIHARAMQSLCSFNLDLVGMTVRSVRVDGMPAAWTRSGQELIITPQHPLKHGHRFGVAVEYDGVPHEFVIVFPDGFELRTGFMATPDGATVAGEPEVAAGWFPVNDHPLDKAAYSFDVTVPREYEVVANGFLTQVSTRGGQTTYEWDAREPMASYLATIDIGRWDVHQWRTESGIPVYDAVDSALTGELRQAIDSSLARQGEVLDVLEEAFGRYPFSTVGAIVDNQDDLFFALENQTRPVYSKYFWLDADGNPDPVAGDFVVAHELAHQWFGDDVAVEHWQHIWLNEGFATYAEWLWAEHEGFATIQESFQEAYDSIPADDPFWDLVIGDPGVPALFDFPVYLRGAMTLQALRNEVGDDAFWRIIQKWAKSQAGGNGSTAEFIALAERISHQQLDALFDAWLFTPGKPAIATASVSGLSSSSTASQGFTKQWLTGLSERLQKGRY
jgi:aminopeptidase N